MIFKFQTAPRKLTRYVLDLKKNLILRFELLFLQTFAIFIFKFRRVAIFRYKVFEQHCFNLLFYPFGIYENEIIYMAMLKL